MRPKQMSQSAGALCAFDPHIFFESHRISHRVCSCQILGGCKLLKRLAPQVGLEPTTLRLTAECSTIELLRSGRLFVITADPFNLCQRGNLPAIRTMGERRQENPGTLRVGCRNSFFFSATQACPSISLPPPRGWFHCLNRRKPPAGLHRRAV